VAWVRLDRWNGLTPKQQRRVVPLCPDFAIDLRSPSDDLTDLQAKMRKYLDNGLQVSWLIDPEQKRVDIYRTDQGVESLTNPKTLSDAALLPGFVLDLSDIFD
jgi:Uma2 family endonuclease